VTVRTVDELIDEAPGLQGQRVFVRADLNVPMADGVIADDTRIRASLPTLRKLLSSGARVVLASHLGRPKGKRDPASSLAPIAEALAGSLGVEVQFAADCIGEQVEQASRALPPGAVLLLENLRFHAGETDNDPAFAKQLAATADVYVNDAFGTAHRAHASTAGMVRHFERFAAGDLMRSELEHLGRLLDPERPFLCLLGGAKVVDKLGVLEALCERADVLAIGGAMAYTFLAARGEPTGASRVEPDRIEDAKRMLTAADESGALELLLPTDHVVIPKPESGGIDANAERRTVETIPDGWMAVDIGPKTAARYAAEAEQARTILWNGPMGIFELAPFASGTETVARAVAAASGMSVVGGGDSLAAIAKLGLAAQIDHVSTGGGASLEFVQGLALPGVSALEL